MTCYKEIQFLEYLDEEMEKEKSEQLEYHLHSCQSCRQLLENLKTEQHLIKDVLDSKEKSTDIQQEFQDRLNKKRFSSISFLKRSTWLRMAAGMLIAGIGLFLLLWFQDAASSVKETEIIIFNTTIEEREAESFIYESGEPDIKYFWFEKELTEQ